MYHGKYVPMSDLLSLLGLGTGPKFAAFSRNGPGRPGRAQPQPEGQTGRAGLVISIKRFKTLNRNFFGKKLV